MKEFDHWDEQEHADLTEDEKQILDDLGLQGSTRRKFLKQVSAASLSLWAASTFSSTLLAHPMKETPTKPAFLQNEVAVSFSVNGETHQLNLDSRTSLLDALREHLGLTGSKKGCDHGQCGACTVMINGKRKLSCLTLAATCESHEVTTIEGLAKTGICTPCNRLS